MAEVVRMTARRPFWLKPNHRVAIGQVFHASPALAERLARRGDAAAEPEPVKTRRRPRKAAP